MNLSGLINKCVEYAHGEDRESQEFFLTKAVGELRGMDISVLWDAGAFFVPNNDYLENVLGSAVLDYENGFYSRDGECLWDNCVVLPIPDVFGEFVGLAAFDPINYELAHQTNNYEFSYYKYTRKDVYRHRYYFYGLKGTFDRAFEDGYVVLTDGVFDTLSFASLGYNAWAALGSGISEQMLAQLRFIRRVIVAMDNDAAGVKMYRFLSRRLDSVCCLLQGDFKDADEMLKSKYSKKYLGVLDEMIASPFTLDGSCFTRDSFHRVLLEEVSAG